MATGIVITSNQFCSTPAINAFIDGDFFIDATIDSNFVRSFCYLPSRIADFFFVKSPVWDKKRWCHSLYPIRLK